MFKLDDNLLRELGLGALPAEEKNRMLAHIYETLEMRVGMKLAEQMTDQQLDEFEAFIDNNDEAGALKWLEANFPNYKQVVAEELEALKTEISQAAPQIVAASQAAGGNYGPTTQPPSHYPPQGNPEHQPGAPAAWPQPPSSAVPPAASTPPPPPMPSWPPQHPQDPGLPPSAQDDDQQYQQ